MRATLGGEAVAEAHTTKIDLVFSSIFDLLPDTYYQVGQLLSEIESQSSDSAQINILINSYHCVGCSQKVISNDCLSGDKHCLYQPILPDKVSAENGSSLLLHSLTMKCLANLNPSNPVETFFKYARLFYEKGCMNYQSEDHYKILLDNACV